MFVVDYSGHNDNITNTDETTIQAAKPRILIDNTPGGLWNGRCVPSHYSPYDIHVFSYITGGYEHSTRGGDTSVLAANLARIDSIASAGAYGVFMDEVDTYPTGDSQAYIAAIYHECQINGLKLILNPGWHDFDTFLISHSDYIMTDEHYHGTRPPSASEMKRLDSVLVADIDATSETMAVAVTDSARNNGFGYSYVCSTYNSLPGWLVSYMAGVSYTTATPVITLSGGTLRSDAAYGNQWYSASSGILVGYNSQNFTPAYTGSYYDIVTLSGCESDTSNLIELIPTAIGSVANHATYRLYPNPASKEMYIEHAVGCSITFFDVVGKAVLHKKIMVQKELLFMDNLCTGVYLARITDEKGAQTLWKIEKK